MVAPTLNYGMSQHHLGFAGSVTLRPMTLMLVVRDVIQSLAVHGFRHFFFINGHGGNVASVTAAFDEVHAGVSLGDGTKPARTKMVFWSGGPRGAKLATELYGNSNGGHATAAEVSLSQYYKPDHIKHAQMTPKVAPSGKQFFEAAHYRETYADGRIGSDPSLSTPEDGARLFEAGVADMIEIYQAFLECDSPFVRRAAMTMIHDGIAFERLVLSSFADFDGSWRLCRLARWAFAVGQPGQSFRRRGCGPATLFGPATPKAPPKAQPPPPPSGP
eukprot:gene9680-9744_t